MAAAFGFPAMSAGGAGSRGSPAGWSAFHAASVGIRLVINTVPKLRREAHSLTEMRHAGQFNQNFSDEFGDIKKESVILVVTVDIAI